MSKETANQPIYARGKTLWMRFYHKGQQIRESTGFKVGQEEHAYQAFIDRKQDIDDAHLGIIKNKSIEDGLLKWLEEYVPHLVGPSVYISHSKSIHPYIKNKPLEQIYKCAAEMKMDLLNKGLKPATINRRLSILKRVATLAYSEWMWLKESPYKKIKSLPEHNSREIALTRDEVENLSNACECEVTKNLIIFAAYTGMRTAEIFELTPFALKDNVLAFVGKGHKTRRLPLQQQEIDFVRKYTPIQLSEGYIKRNFRGAANSIGMEHVKFHDLRHTFGTWLAQAGTPLNRIMSLMGHTTVLMAQRYINMCVEDLRNDMPLRPEPKPEPKADLKLVNLRGIK